MSTYIYDWIKLTNVLSTTNFLHYPHLSSTWSVSQGRQEPMPSQVDLLTEPYAVSAHMCLISSEGEPGPIIKSQSIHCEYVQKPSLPYSQTG